MASVPAAPASEKSARVKAVFEEPQRYLNNFGLHIRVRAETVQAYAARLDSRRVLDIGCGDGSISLPLLNRRTHVTLLDFSASMTALARSRVPEELAGQVDVRNEDFMTATFADRFDLIVCLGVLAHADSPEKLLGKIASLLAPGGHLILQFTDAYHFSGRLERMLRAVREFIAPARFPVNLFSFERVARLTGASGLRFVSQYRFGLPPIPGVEMLGGESLYKLVRLVHGSCGHERNAWLGSEYICLLSRDSAA